MMREPIANLAASVKARLLRLSRERHEQLNPFLERYAYERFLYRLSQSTFAGQFILKGALAFATWQMIRPRPTRDLDLLGYGNSSREALTKVFRDICTLDTISDGLVFDVDSLQITETRPDEEYAGKRVELWANLGKARIPMQIDIGFGDAVTPAAVEATFPTLLPDFPAPRLRRYPWETVVAEKLQAMVVLGIANSRVKDFHDIWMLARGAHFDGLTLCEAIRSTFARRQTAVPATPPLALTGDFGQVPSKVSQWEAFIARDGIDMSGAHLSDVITELARFLLPLLSAITDEIEFRKIWPPGGPWLDDAETKEKP